MKSLHSTRQRGLVRVSLLLFCALGSMLGAASSAPAITTSVEVDWKQGLILFDLSLSVDRESRRNALEAINRAQQLVRERAMQILPFSFGKLQLDSKATLDEYGQLRPEFESELTMLSASISLLYDQPSRDLALLHIRYELPFTQARLRGQKRQEKPSTLISLVNSYEVPQTIPAVLDWLPQQPYTGIVIDARGSLPWYGMNMNAEALPVLLPEIYDELNNPVLLKNMVNPTAMADWGIAGYTDRPDDALVASRAGTNPMFVSARAVFGIVPASPMIGKEEARLILANESTRKALQEGRIVLLVDTKLLKQKLN